MKKLNTKTSTKIATIVLAAAAAFSVMGCGITTTTTYTETVTDADGNTTTTTTTNNNGEVTTETTSYTADEAEDYSNEDVDVEEISSDVAYEKVPLAFTNEMGWDVAEFYLKMSDQSEWSDNFLGEGYYIDNGTTADGITVNYDEDQHFLDIRVADYTGSEEVFENIELPAEGAESIEIVLGYDEVSGEFTATVVAE